MLKLMGWIFKTSFFIFFILVLGQIITWKGNTVSDHVKVGMFRIKRTIKFELLSLLSNNQFAKKIHSEDTNELESINHFEKAKMRALIRDLNK